MPPSKPRNAGIIEIRGPYYTPVTYQYLKGLLEDWGEYVDGYKFAGGSMRLLARDRVRQIIQLCHDYGVDGSTGGVVERGIVQGAGAVGRYLDEGEAVEYDMGGVSGGLAPMKLAGKGGIGER